MTRRECAGFEAVVDRLLAASKPLGILCDLKHRLADFAGVGLFERKVLDLEHISSARFKKPNGLLA